MLQKGSFGIGFYIKINELHILKSFYSKELGTRKFRNPDSPQSYMSQKFLAHTKVRRHALLTDCF